MSARDDYPNMVAWAAAGEDDPGLRELRRAIAEIDRLRAKLSRLDEIQGYVVELGDKSVFVHPHHVQRVFLNTADVAS